MEFIFGKYHSVSFKDTVILLNDEVRRKKASNLLRQEMMSSGMKTCPCIYKAVGRLYLE